MPEVRARKAPSLPNRFVALVPDGQDGKVASEFARTCESHIQESWWNLSHTVKEKLDNELRRFDAEWAQNWNAQIESFLDITTSICSTRGLDDKEMANLIGGKGDFSQVWAEAHRVRQMAESIPNEDTPRFPQNRAGQWQAQLEVSARIAEAQRTIRHVPQMPSARPKCRLIRMIQRIRRKKSQINLSGPAGPKCSLMGTYEQVGPAKLQESRDFWKAIWNQNNRLREPDRLCAIALCKRFAAEHVLAPKFELKKRDVRFPDTATIAAKNWLDEAGIIPDEKWNGRWIHQKRRDQDKDSAPSKHVWKRIRNAKKESSPPSYYAILVMDADDMGLWLKGEKAPYVTDVIHEKVRQYFENLGIDSLNAKRPVSPALHSSISEALNNFASVVVPKIVEYYDGTLIYSGVMMSLHFFQHSKQ